ncbi:PhzF family phenazine biosynthesis protein [Oceanirhabdus sp. W0125-5]|uniref:PhzF family phenazine biosynthesis protein n=1 Tax=Oceanirhabdus sp. W0125-5 TaxID=2999116 RepID=UPI0022F2B15A|nr:PhzF family phenazine biosynthesis protein [Oceanirhabdus sp. W0125-5]WBW95629.1 PhzF family phenazine biosynthesis protein [Oceanirhabdus sp. W0125-5]
MEQRTTELKKINIKQVDAFTSIPFGGNPAGVVTEASTISDDIKQKIAKEMNLSETAFVSQSEVADFKIQFFTPKFEVDLCGHATIGTFSALYEEGKLDLNKSKYYQETKAGVLPVELVTFNDKKIFMMNQPTPKFEMINMSKNEVANLLGLNEEDLLDIPPMKTNTGIWWLVFGVKELEKLKNAKLDLQTIEKISEKYKVIGIAPFCLETFNENYDYHMRAIAPYVGVVEDPVCGTGNGCVASYIVRNNLVKSNQQIDLIGEQGQEVDRPGCVYVNILIENGDISEVKVGGSAVTIISGEITY